MNPNPTKLGKLACGAALLSLLNSGFANTQQWIGNPGVSATTNWSDTANWSVLAGGGSPGPAGNDVVFGDTGAVGSANVINGVIDNSTLGTLSLTFTNQSHNALYHTILIPSGVSFTNNANFTVGLSSTINNYKTTVNFVGGGTLVQTGANLTIKDINSAASSQAYATLDLSGLSNFVYRATAGTLVVASSGSDARGGGVLNLANGTNSLTCATINLATGNGNGGGAQNSMNLGAGTNIINATTLNICAGKVNNATLKFFDAASGSLRLRGVGGTDTDRVTISILNRNTGGTGGMTGNVDLTGGHYVDIKAGTITIGQAGTNPSSANQAGTASFRFDTGIVDATTINMAINTVANATTTANLIVGGGSLVVSNVSLVNQTSTGVATGNLFLGGNMTCSGNIAKTTLAGTGNITITNGTLTLASTKTIGTLDRPIDNFSLTTATLQMSVVNALTNIAVSALNLVDDGNLLNVAALPSIGGFPTVLPVLSYVSSIGGGSLHLGTLPGGYSGYVSNDLVNTLWLVITNGLVIAKTDVWSGNVNNLWDTSTLNWTNTSGAAVSYNNGDFVLFDNTGKTNTVNLTASLTPSTLNFNNSALNYTLIGSGKISGPVALVKDGSGTLTLAATGGDNFSSGIVVSNGALVLDDANCAISGGLSVGTGATAQIGNNSTNGALPAGSVAVDGVLIFKRTNDLTVAVAVSGAGSLSQLGSARLSLTSANTYTGDTTVSGGTLAVSGAGSISSSAQVSVSNAALDLSSATTATTLTTVNLTNATLSLNMPGVTAPLNVTALNFGGAGNTINLASLPSVATYPSTITIISSANVIAGFNATIGTFPAGSPAFGGTLSLNPAGTAVQLTLTNGPVGIRPAVFWSGADAVNSNLNWSDGPNWLLPGAPAPTENVIFNVTGTVGASAINAFGGGIAALAPENINNIVDANFTVPLLTYTNLGGTYHNTFIANGKVLTVTNTLTVGAIDGGSPAQQEYVAIAGTNATLTVNNTNANLQVWLGNGSVNSYATLDLSALDTFNASISRLTVGASAINNAVNRPGGRLYLARTNVITAGFQTTTIESAGTTTGNAALAVADCNQNAGSQSYIYLGRVNTISADTIAIGRQKAGGHLLFNSIYANIAPYPTVAIQGATSGRVSVFNVADAVGNTGTTSFSADTDLSGGIVNASIDLMNLGRSSSGGTSGNTTGTLTFDAGTINVNTVNLGLQPAANTKAGIGVLNVNSNATIGAHATLVVNGNLNLATAPAGGGLLATAGTLNINAATVQASNIVAGVGTSSTINLTDGTLAITATAGTAAAPLGTLNLSGGTLQLNADGNATAAALVATTINVSGTTIVNISAIANVTGTITIPLISYTGTDPYANLSLGTSPAGYSVSLEDNTANSTVDLKLTLTSLSQPHITSVAFATGSISLAGTNGTASGSFRVLTATDIALPRSSWTPVVTNNFNSSGTFNISIPLTAGEPQRFYLLAVP